jgi:hypothetical protein
MWFIVGAIVGIIIGAIIAALIMSAANAHADEVMFRTLRTYDFETKTRYALVPEQQAIEIAETKKALLRVV